jgi:hypothetical protein
MAGTAAAAGDWLENVAVGEREECGVKGGGRKAGLEREG